MPKCAAASPGGALTVVHVSQSTQKVPTAEAGCDHNSAGTHVHFCGLQKRP